MCERTTIPGYIYCCFVAHRLNLPTGVAARSKVELPSSAQTLGSWARIPLEAMMYLCVNFVCVD
jgi:hypothetical protein